MTLFSYVATILLLIDITAYSNPSFSEEKRIHNYIPKSGYVPDSRTAILISEAVLTPIYGKHVIDKEKPFTAKRVRAIWIVTGSLKKGFVGGVARIEIDSATGKILRVTHSE